MSIYYQPTPIPCCQPIATPCCSSTPLPYRPYICQYPDNSCSTPICVDGLTGPTGPAGSGSSTGNTGSTGAIGPTGAKTFVIDHPTKDDHYLVHACIEGPEAGVYYRGTSQVINKYVTIHLPEYVDKLADEYTVHVTPIVQFDELEPIWISMISTTIKNNSFKVYASEPCHFNWLVMGKRRDTRIAVEIKRGDHALHGDGPYKWVS
jgi:hypothetical protein